MANTDKVVVTKSKLTAIADAIRSKNSTTDKMSLDSIPTIIADLKTGGDLSETTVELNLASGDQSVSAPAGTGYSKITISKPATLLPANIASGVEIAGVMGTANVAKPGGEPAVEYEGGDGIKISFSDNRQLKSLSFTSAFNGAIPNITDMSSMFAYCYKLASLNLSSFDTSKVTNMSYMFRDCQALTSLNLSSFDTSKVTNMSYMFRDCQALKFLNLSSFDTSKVTNMSYMFRDCQALTSLRFPSNKSFDIKDTALAHNGLVVLLNDLKSVTTTQTLTMGSAKLALLSDAEKKIATDKGWTLA